jgi:hypothetical protein
VFVCSSLQGREHEAAICGGPGSAGRPGESARAALPDHIYMDAMAFGMGCCCLQMTFQACSIDEARILYDQLTPLTPIIVSTYSASFMFYIAALNLILLLNTFKL